MASISNSSTVEDTGKWQFTGKSIDLSHLNISEAEDINVAISKLSLAVQELKSASPYYSATEYFEDIHFRNSFGIQESLSAKMRTLDEYIQRIEYNISELSRGGRVVVSTLPGLKFDNLTEEISLDYEFLNTVLENKYNEKFEEFDVGTSRELAIENKILEKENSELRNRLDAIEKRLGLIV